MIVLGLLLVVLAGATGAFAVFGSSSTAQMVHLEGIGLSISASPLAIYLAGAVSVVLIGLGFSLIRRGTRHKASSRKELRELRKAAAETADADPR